MPFVNPLFLIGALAAGIPLVLHLVHTTRAPQMPFPTVRFLKLAAEKTARRRRVQNLLLLVMRMLLMALLAVALARPFVSPDLAMLGGSSTQAAVVLDNSMSAGVTYGGKSRLEHLKDEAEALLKSGLRPAETLLLVAGEVQPPGESAFMQNRDEVIRSIRRSEVRARRANLADMLCRAYAAFDRTAAADRRLYVFTDLQAASWAGIAELKAVKEHPDIPLCVIHTADPDASNVAVIAARALGTEHVVGFPVPIEVGLWSSPEVRGKRALSLYVDDMSHPREQVAVQMPIEVGRNDCVVFRPTFSSAGRRRLRVEIEAEDSLPIDNVRRLAVDVRGDILAVLVRDPRGLAGEENPLLYVAEALAAPQSGAADAPWAVATQAVSPTELSDELLARTRAVVMSDVAQLADDLRGRLTAFVERGGTLVVFPGPATVPAGWNRAASEDARGRRLLPAALGTIRSETPDARQPAKVIDVAADSSVLAGLADPAYYRPAVVSRYFVLQPASQGGARKLLTLDTGDPLLVAGDCGAGHVYFFAVPATGDWSNLQRTNVFLPLVLRMVHGSVLRMNWPADIISGEAVSLSFGTTIGGPFDLLVADPEHATMPRRQRPDDAASGAFTLRDTLALGFYDVWPDVSPAQPDLAWTFSVNPDGGESDLTPLGLDELHRRVPAREMYLAKGIADLEKQLKSLGRKELWQHFLVAVLLLTIFECLISNRLHARHESGGVQTLVDRLRGRKSQDADKEGDVPKP